MTQEEIIKEIKRLTPEQQQEILDVIGMEQPQLPKDRASIVSRLYGAAKPDFRSSSETQESQRVNSSLSQRLYGILEFEGGSPTDEEVKATVADYLLENPSASV